MQPNWTRLLGAPSNIKCQVRVEQFPDGEVVSAVTIDSCGSLALDRSAMGTAEAKGRASTEVLRRKTKQTLSETPVLAAAPDIKRPSFR